MHVHARNTPYETGPCNPLCFISDGSWNFFFFQPRVKLACNFAFIHVLVCLKGEMEVSRSLLISWGVHKYPESIAPKHGNRFLCLLSRNYSIASFPQVVFNPSSSSHLAVTLTCFQPPALNPTLSSCTRLQPAECSLPTQCYRTE